MLLAAGAGRRYGGPKLLQACWHERPIAESAARRLMEVLPNTVAVVANEDDELGRLLRRCGARLVCNPDPSRGMGSSIATAVRASSAAHGWVVALGDMPWVESATIVRVVEALRDGADAAAPYFEGRRGHPVAFSARLRSHLLALDGPQGARRVFEAARSLVRIDVQDRGVMLDVDRPSDLQRSLRAIDHGQ